MDVTQKRCQVVMRKINLGERAMHKCVVPVKKLRVGDSKTEHRVRHPKRVLSHIQLHKLTVLLRKLGNRRHGMQQAGAGDSGRSVSELSKVQLQKLQVLLHKQNLKESQSKHSYQEDRDKRLRVLLQKLNPDTNKITESAICSGSMGQKQETSLRTQLQDLKVLLKKLKLTQSESFILDNGNVSTVQLQKFKILLRKVKMNQTRQQNRCQHLGKVTLNQTRQDQPQPVADVASVNQPSCSYLDVPNHLNRQRFRVLIKRLKLKREIQERLDHTIFIDDKLGFVANPYLIPGFHRSRILNRNQVKVLKIGRRSRASRCHVRIRKLQL